MHSTKHKFIGFLAASIVASIKLILLIMIMYCIGYLATYTVKSPPDDPSILHFVRMLIGFAWYGVTKLGISIGEVFKRAYKYFLEIFCSNKKEV